MLVRTVLAIIVLLASLGALAAGFLEAKFPNGSTVQLYQDVGGCKSGLRALWFTRGKTQQVGGCYTISPSKVVEIRWADGGESSVWLDYFKPQEGI